MTTVREARVVAVREAIARAFFENVPERVFPGANMGASFDRMAAAVVNALFLPDPLIDNAEIGE